MDSSRTLVIDRAVKRRAHPLNIRWVTRPCTEAEPHAGWWAGLLIGRSDEAATLGFRSRDVAIVADDPHHRRVVWIEDLAVRDRPPIRQIADHIILGAGILWNDPPPEGSLAEDAWKAIRHAHAEALLVRAAEIPERLHRLLRSDAVTSVAGAVRTWLEGDEELAVQRIHSTIAQRVAIGAPGYVADRLRPDRRLDRDGRR